MKIKNKIIKPIHWYLLGVFCISIFTGWNIVTNHQLKVSTVKLDKKLDFEKKRTVLKIRKDTLIDILTKWQIERPKKFDTLDFKNGIDSNWVRWSYKEGYKNNIIEDILGDEAIYQRPDSILVIDNKNRQLKFKVDKDTAYVYVRFITQYYSTINFKSRN